MDLIFEWGKEKNTKVEHIECQRVVSVVEQKKKTKARHRLESVRGLQFWIRVDLIDSPFEQGPDEWEKTVKCLSGGFR